MTPLTKFLVESREDFLAKFWKLSGIGPGELERKQEECVDSLIHKAYELGQQNPRVGFLRQYLNEQPTASPNFTMWTDEQILTFLRIPFSEKALDSAIGEAQV